MRFYYFYILRSQNTGKLYLGYTANLKGRVEQHNNGKNKATKPYIPYELVFFSGFKNRTDALNCEKYFKTTSGWRRLKNMLENYLNTPT